MVSLRFATNFLLDNTFSLGIISFTPFFIGDKFQHVRFILTVSLWRYAAGEVVPHACGAFFKRIYDAEIKGF
jgi:hypothetical protein